MNQATSIIAAVILVAGAHDATAQTNVKGELLKSRAFMNLAVVMIAKCKWPEFVGRDRTAIASLRDQAGKLAASRGASAYDLTMVDGASEGATKAMDCADPQTLINMPDMIETIRAQAGAAYGR